MVVEGGNSLVKRGQGAGRDRAERRRKADLIAEAWAIGGIDGVAFGAQDWGLGSDFVRGLVTEHQLPLLAANLTCDGTAYPGARVVEVGGVHVGIAGVTTGEVDGCEVSPPGPALKAAIASVSEPVDVWVGLLPLTGEDLTQALAAAPELTVMIDGASGRRATPHENQGVMVAGAGSRTKYLGVLRLTVNDPAAPWVAEGGRAAVEKEVQRLQERLERAKERADKTEEAARKERYEKQAVAYEQRLAEKQAELAELGKTSGTENVLVEEVRELSDEVQDHAATRQLVDALLTELESGATVSGATIAEMPREVSGNPTFAGAQVCRSCHESQYAQWAGTPHAHAWATLVDEGRSMESDCWSCHSTGANQPDGPTFAEEVGGLHDVQCESCHGPSAAHAQSPGTAIKPIRTPDVATCTTCHDGEQDGGQFDLGSYLPRVTHD